MAKKIFSIFMISVFTFFSFADGSKKVSEPDKKNFRFFSGFEFADLDGSMHKKGLEDCVKEEISYVLKDDLERNYKEKYGIVGHSQGGLRVLAYATMLKRQSEDFSLTENERNIAKENYERLTAVITMSGIDKGLKALENNFATLKAKLLEDGNIILNGVYGLLKSSILLEGLGFFDKDILNLKDAGTIIDIVACFVPDVARSYLYKAWEGADYAEIPELYDMVPDSEFIRKNVSKTQKVVYKKQTGTRKYKTWEKVSWCWWWWVDHSEPVYTTYTAYKDIPLFDADLAVGYIIGTDSNTLGMAEDESGVRNGIDIAANFLEGAQIANHAKCYATAGIGFLTGHYTAYQNCCKARDWAKNIDGELNELKGSDENDGLVAKESQFYPKQFYNPVTGKYEDVHTKVLLDRNGKGYTEVNKNHRDINCDDVLNSVVLEMLSEAGVK